MAESDISTGAGVVASCGNVFADLGLPDAEGLLAQADVRLVKDDCRCTFGSVCRRNNACPRLTRDATER